MKIANQSEDPPPEKGIAEENQGIFPPVVYFSTVRRIIVNGIVRAKLEQFFSGIPVPKRLELQKVFIFYGIFRILKMVFDFLECLRIGRKVPNFGNAQQSNSGYGKLLPQYPKYTSYWCDHESHALVGMHVGMDVLRKGENYYLLENNLDAGINERFYNLFAHGLNPLISTYLKFAEREGYRNVFLYRREWPPYFVEEFNKVNSAGRVRFKLVELFKFSRDNFLDLPLERDSLHVIFSSRQTGVEHLVHDKSNVLNWFQKATNQSIDQSKRLKAIPSSGSFFWPGTVNPPQFPDLVIKLSGFDHRSGIYLLKAENKTSAMKILGIEDPNEFPNILGLNPWQKMHHHLFNSAKVIYQPFVVGDLIDDKFTKYYRILGFISPQQNFVVAPYIIQSSLKIPEYLEPGISKVDGRFIPWGVLGAIFHKANADEVRQADEIVREFGAIAQSAISTRYETGIRL